MVRTTVLISLLFLTGLYPAVSAGKSPCGDNGILVQAKDPQDIYDACQAVRSSARFFKPYGLTMPKGIQVMVVDSRQSPLLEEHEMGTYDSRHNVIRVRAYSSAVKATEMNEPGLGKITTRAHWRSYITHELAHAAIHADCDKTCPSRAIHEYIAAVAQIASLPKKQRTKLLRQYSDLQPFDKLSEITEIYYAVNPHYFAVKSYKHYLRLANPRDFLRDALNLSDQF